MFLSQFVLRGGSSVRTFNSVSNFYISGRGLAYQFDKDQWPTDLWNPKDLVGEMVSIDGVEHLVRGVEAFVINVSPTYPYRGAFGILT